MAKTFAVKLPEDTLTALADAKAAAKQNGVDFIGDHLSGHFKGKGIEGCYEISENVLAVTVLKKPLILPWSLIEATVMEFLS